MMISDLPGDLLEEILCRIPATSVKPLRSTCKRWNRLFNDNRFSRKHFDRAAKQFLVFDLKEFRVCSISVNLNETPSFQVIGSKLSLNDSYSNSAKTNIDQVSSCDGLLLCTIKNDDSRIVVWNPCTGQTKWIQSINRYKEWEWDSSTYTLGSYQDYKSRNISYKILRIFGYIDEFEIFDINSNSWRTLHGPDCYFSRRQSVPLKGKTYWLGLDGKEENVILVSFDYTRERFEHLPCQFPKDSCPNLNEFLSVVGEEKLCMLLQRPSTLKNEIWVTNKLYEAKRVSWIKIFTVDYPGSDYRFDQSYFVVDEEKRSVLMCCEKLNDPWDEDISKCMYVVGENNNKRLAQVEFGAPGYWPRMQDYVPSLIQIL